VWVFSRATAFGAARGKSAAPRARAPSRERLDVRATLLGASRGATARSEKNDVGLILWMMAAFGAARGKVRQREFERLPSRESLDVRATQGSITTPARLLKKSRPWS